MQEFMSSGDIRDILCNIVFFIFSFIILRKISDKIFVKLKDCMYRDTDIFILYTAVWTLTTYVVYYFLDLITYKTGFFIIIEIGTLGYLNSAETFVLTQFVMWSYKYNIELKELTIEKLNFRDSLKNFILIGIIILLIETVFTVLTRITGVLYIFRSQILLTVLSIAFFVYKSNIKKYNSIELN